MKIPKNRHPYDMWANAAGRRQQGDGISVEDASAQAATAHMQDSDVDKAMPEWAHHFQPQPVTDGHYRDAPVNDPSRRQSGQLAEGHQFAPHRVDGAPGVQVDYQQMTPRAGAMVTADATQGMNSQGWRDALRIHQAVSVMDQMHASQPHLGGQLGQRDPMGITGAPRQGIPATAGSSEQAGGTPPLPTPKPGPGYESLPPFSAKPYRKGKK